MPTYENGDGSPKGPFVTGDLVRVIAKNDAQRGRILPVLSVNGNAVRLAVPNNPDRGDRYWSYEIEAA